MTAKRQKGNFKMKERTLMLLGNAFLKDATIKEACAQAHISPDTFHRWAKENPGFADTMDAYRTYPLFTARSTVVDNFNDPKIALAYLKLDKNRKKEEDWDKIPETDYTKMGTPALKNYLAAYQQHAQEICSELDQRNPAPATPKKQETLAQGSGATPPPKPSSTQSAAPAVEPLRIKVGDVSAVTDSAMTHKPLLISVGDTSVVTDTITAEEPLLINVEDTTEASDKLDMTRSRPKLPYYYSTYSKKEREKFHKEQGS